MKTKQRGFIITQTMITILMFLAMIMSSPMVEKQKNEIKLQLVGLIQNEITAQEVKVQEVNQQEEAEASATVQEKVLVDNFKAKEFYSVVEADQHGKGVQKFSNDVEYTVEYTETYGFTESKLALYFYNRYMFPVEWLIAENYIPELNDINDLARIKKIFDCEFHSYLDTQGRYDYVSGEREACDYFLKLDRAGQYQYNSDYKEERGRYYF